MGKKALTDKDILAAACEFDPTVRKYMTGHFFDDDYTECLEALAVDLLRKLRQLEDQVAKQLKC
jgi:hypothetical protein